MTKFCFLFLWLPTVSLVSLSCTEKTPPPTPRDNAETNFYFGIKATLSPDDLENEMAEGQSAFLKTFADDEIPWQLWDQEILEKADQAQLPILAYVGSPLGRSSRRISDEIDAHKTLPRRLSQQSICTVIDSRLHPEIGQLCMQLANEVNETFSYPMVVWTSPEGCPIAWFPLGTASGKKLEGILEIGSAMIEDIWYNSSRYAIKNSRNDNAARQNRFNFDPAPKNLEESRAGTFRKATRQLSSFYSPVAKDLDSLGGVIPSSSLELLLIGSRPGLFDEWVGKRSRQAVIDVTEKLVRTDLRDPLDGAYFYARRASTWILPIFSKDIGSQARLAEYLLKAGSRLDNREFLEEGLNLTRTLEDKWLAQNLATLSPGVSQDLPGGFLWDFQTLQEVLSEEEFELARLAFSLRKDGNIPAVIDPTGEFYQLNSLRNEGSPEEWARKLGRTSEAVAQDLAGVKAKLLAHRAETARMVPENILTVTELGLMTRAQIARSVVTRKEDDLQAAIVSAEGILAQFWDPEKGLTRFKNGEQALAARGRDYAATTLVMTLLYQRTLDDRWLAAARKIIDHALEKLASDSPILSETPPADRIIPLRLHDISMNSGPSTLGLADQAVKRLAVLTGDRHYQDLCRNHLAIIAPRPVDNVVNHTDFSISCALGDTPLVAVLQGGANSTPGKKLLAGLNSSRHLPYVIIRPETAPPGLATLPPLPVKKGEASVILVKEGKILGQAATEEELTGLLDSAISRNP